MPGQEDDGINTIATHAEPNAILPGKPASSPSERDEANEKVPRWMQVRKENHGWRRVIQNFTPSWFSVTMGTGIVSILLHTISTTYSSPWLSHLSIGVFALNVFLFAAVFTASVLRYAMYPAVWSLMLQHPTQSLFLGTAPMGFATLINMFVFVCVPRWGEWAKYAAWGMWWLDAAVSLATCFGLPFMMMHVHPGAPLSAMTAVWLLPIVAPVVASASGSIVAEILPNPEHALWTVLTSYVLWGTSVPLAMCTLVIYFQRLAMHKLPPREAIVSVFLPVGPLGQGGFAILNLGKLAMEVFPKTQSLHPMAGDMLYVSGFLTALVMWGFGLCWMFFALASTTRGKFPFNIGWWGFTFPLGVFATSTLLLGKELPSKFFSVLGVVFSGCVILLWLVVGSYTVKKAASGEMFYAPCLACIEDSKPEKGSSRV